MSQNNSLADRVIKNSYYQVLLQLFTFVFPIILTPLIISKIGEEQFGIYALVLGFITVFSLFDLSFSSSFIVFISRYFENDDTKNLNSYFNTGFFFYLIFASVICTIAYFLAVPLLSLLNIPPELLEISQKVYYIGLAVFFINSVFAIFQSVLISMQKMYLTSTAGIAGGVLNFVLTISALYGGFGLAGILYSQLATAIFISLANWISAKKLLPDLKINPSSVTSGAAREMAKFGSQMQLSKLAGFASEKYDEFLLAHFTALGNVTYFNIASRISRTGRIIPFQIIPQIAPVASGLKAKNEETKLASLFDAASRYLILASAPVFVFIFAFSDLIIKTWMGSGFEISGDILKVLVIGQLANMAFSAPGNSVIPNTGNPKYQMNEGLINLGINIFLSFLLIKYYGIFGAALGSVISTMISSWYVFHKSAGNFKKDVMRILSEIYLIPFSASVNAGIVSYLIYYVCTKLILPAEGRIAGLVYLFFLLMIFMAVFIVSVLRSRYLQMRDKILIAKTVYKLMPCKKFNTAVHEIIKPTKAYNGEIVSIFIVTHNRLGMLKKCINSLVPTLKEINYELIIIDNASEVGTKEYLSSISSRNDRMTVIRNENNKGTNAKSQAAEICKGDFIIGVDDDVIEFPEGWIEKMVRAYKAIPGMGYLSSDVYQDETTTGAKQHESQYIRDEYSDGITLLVGPAGGWCFMISREVYEKTGKLLTYNDRIFFSEDGDYVNRIRNNGYKFGILENVKVYHAAGEFHNREYKKVFDEKYKDYKKGDPISHKITAWFKSLIAYQKYVTRVELLSRQKPEW